jgi:hypothetical protein
MYNSFRLFKVTFGFIFILAIVAIIFKGVFISRAISSGKTLYQIDVNNYKDMETYITEKYIVDPNTKCVSFKDEMGIKRIVCNNYTITEY